MIQGSKPFQIAAVAAVSLFALGACAPGDGGSAADTLVEIRSSGAHTYKVDPHWPRELPNDWIMSTITGVYVDSRDHVWVTHLPELLTPEEISAVQNPPLGTCCVPAPTVLEYNPQGEIVNAWGTPDQDVAEWPINPHGIFVDHNDYVWVGSHVTHRLMKFSRDGRLVMQVGEYQQTGGSNHTSLLGGPAGVWVDPNTNEAFIADGYRNRRVIVVNGETGEYLRHWGAYGETPDDDYDYGDRDPAGPPPRAYSTVHGLIGSNDGHIYVADRRGNRIQVFRQDGTYVSETIIAPETRSSGSAFVLTLSPDANEEFLYMADGTNHKVWVLDRASMEVVAEFGRGGRHVGEMLRPHGISRDSQGRIYIGEASTGRRIQRFVRVD
jgi:DNA-binding beta-propeller fold protein YncE